jgi:hypothetical protein
MHLQELLGKELSFKREVDSLKDRLAQCEREVVRVTTAARMHKGDKVRLSSVQFKLKMNITIHSTNFCNYTCIVCDGA